MITTKLIYCKKFLKEKLSFLSYLINICDMPCYGYNYPYSFTIIPYNIVAYSNGLVDFG